MNSALLMLLRTWFSAANLTAPATTSIPSTHAFGSSDAKARASAPVPVPKSRIRLGFKPCSNTHSTNDSVSALGISVSGDTFKSKSQKPWEPII